MPPRLVIGLHWALLGAALSEAVALGILSLWRLRLAFEQDALTRQTLFQALSSLAVILTLLWASGWVFATRPRAPRRHVPEDIF